MRDIRKLGWVASWVACVTCLAQAPVPTTGAPVTTPAGASQTSSPQATRLGVGDQLLVSVADLDEVTGRSVRIAEDGSIDLPLVGAVQAGGTSLPVLRAVLAAAFSKYVTNPQVTLQLVSSQNQLVSVIGDVNTPNVQELTGPLTLLAAITRAGGAKPDAGPQVIVTREARWGMLPIAGATLNPGAPFSRASISLDDLVAEKTPENNILLRPGDVVSIPKGSIIYVVGNVHRAGGFPLRSSGSLSVIEALALAEGLTANSKSEQSKILRPSPTKGEKRIEIAVDIPKVLAGKQTDPQLFADDILYIPNSAAKTGARRAAEAILQVTTGLLIYR